MNPLKKTEKNSKIFVFLTIYVIIFSSFFFLNYVSDHENLDPNVKSEETIYPAATGDEILNKLIVSCSNDERIHSYEGFYLDDKQSFGSFPSETKIFMADGSSRNIKEVKVNDKIYSFDIEKKDFVVSNVISKYSNKCDGFFSINDEFLTTDSIPVLVKKSDGSIIWASLNPVKSAGLYPNRQCDLIEVGDKLYSLEKGWIEIENIEYIDTKCEVYTIQVDSIEHNFFANGFLVSNAGDNFYVLEGFKEGIDFFYKFGYTIFNLSKVKNLTQMSYDELKEKFDISIKYDFRIIINVQDQTYSSTVDSTIYESDVSAVVSKNVLIRDSDLFYYGWVRIEVFVS